MKLFSLKGSSGYAELELGDRRLAELTPSITIRGRNDAVPRAPIADTNRNFRIAGGGH